MEKLMEILEDLRPDVDFETEEALVSDEVLTSFEIVSLIASISDEFGVEVTSEYLVPKNFNSAKALWNMICELQDE